MNEPTVIEDTTNIKKLENDVIEVATIHEVLIKPKNTCKYCCSTGMVKQVGKHGEQVVGKGRKNHEGKVPTLEPCPRCINKKLYKMAQDGINIQKTCDIKEIAGQWCVVKKQETAVKTEAIVEPS